MSRWKVTVLSAFMMALNWQTGYTQPDILWTSTIGGNDDDTGASVRQTSDGGYIIAAVTESYGAGGFEAYLIKTDSAGDSLWTRTYGGSENDGALDVQQTSDRGYIIVGYTASYGAGGLDVYLIKTDSNGDSLWTRTFGGSSTDWGGSVQQTSDGGYIIAGYTASYATQYTDVWLIKTDANGDSLWTRTFGGSNWDYGKSVRQTDDGGYIIAGYTGSYPANNFNVYLIKTDAYGNSVWTRIFGGGENDEGWCVEQTSEGGYIVVGYTWSYGAGGYDVYLIKTDASGNSLWTRTFGGINSEYGFSVRQILDGGYIISGSTQSYAVEYKDLYLIKTDSTGVQEWYLTSGGYGWSEGRCVQQTSDNGYVVVGYDEIYGSYQSDVYLLKTAAEFAPSDLSIELTYLSGSPIPASGGTLSFNISAGNAGNNPAMVDLWTKVTLPNGTEYGPLLLVQNVTLPAGQTINRDRFQYVPPGAPGGDYTYDAYLGAYPDSIIVEDHFNWEKTSDDAWIPAGQNWSCWGEGFEGESQDAPVSHGDAVTHSSPSPNPFNPTTVISYQLPTASKVHLAVYDIAGRQVAELVDGWRDADLHDVTFDATGLASGMYIYRLTAADFTAQGKMVLMK